MSISETTSCRDIILSNDYEDILVDYVIGERSIQTIYNPNCILPLTSQIASIFIERNTDTIDPVQKFGYYNVPKCYGLLDTSAVDNVGVFQLRRLPYINLNGRNVIIGFIDTGIDYTHKVFTNPDNTTRIARIWDQNIQTGTAPNLFGYGSEYTNEDINAALRSENPLEVVPSTDTVGHGTFLAGVAAGNIIEEDDFSGIAPLARIAVVKLKEAKPYLREFFGIPSDVTCYQENDIIAAMRYLLTVAIQLNLPIVICLGIGTNQGSHEGTSYLSKYIQELSSSIGICICCAGGNEGNKRHHFSSIISRNSTQNVELEVGTGGQNFTMEIWNNAPGSLSVGFTSPGGETIQKLPVRFNSFQRIDFFPEPTSIGINYDPAEIRTGDALVLLRFNEATEGIWNITIYNDTSFDITYHIWLPMEPFISPEVYFIRPDPDTTLVSIANGFAEISVTAYDHISDSIYLNSSRGYTRGNRIKPDLSAPGVNVFGPGLGNTYTTRSGTSVSSAIVAGLASLIFEWGITDANLVTLSGNTVRLYLIRGAEQPANTTFPNKEWGYGQVDIYNVFTTIRAPVI